MNSTTHDDLDFKTILLSLWQDRLKISIGTAGAILLAGFYAFFIAKPLYISSTLLVPTEQPSADQLGAAAALLGKKSMGMGDLDLYQSLLTSRVVLGKMLNTNMKNEHDTSGGRIERLATIMKIDTSDRESWENSIGKLTRSISVGTKETGAGGILEVRVGAQYPWLAQQMADNLIRIGQEELRSVRRDRYSAILASLEEAVTGAKEEWDTVAYLHAIFLENNRSNQLPKSVLELSKLEMDKAAKEQKYLLARRELETQKLEKAKAAAPMVILDPANLPAKKSKPKRAFIVVVGFMLGFIGSSAISLGITSFRRGVI